MGSKSLVSAVIIFLNAEKYIQEAIESVYAQTYPYWDLLLVDDGSTDASTEIARRYAAQRPGQVRYLGHPDHANRGMSASRNLGIKHANGEYIAFLDADDVWLPHKLEEQVALLDSNVEAGMLYGETQYWHSWTQNPEDSQHDFVPALGVPPDTLCRPPTLLPLFLRGKAAVPCTCSILVRRSVISEIGGFVETFNGIYEDQAFYAKMCLKVPVLVANTCWDRYRQHPQASMAVAMKTGQEMLARRFFLRWLQEYLNEQKVGDVAIWQALQRELWRIQDPVWLPPIASVQYLARWVKKWLLQIEERTFPASISHWLWTR